MAIEKFLKIKYFSQAKDFLIRRARFVIYTTVKQMDAGIEIRSPEHFIRGAESGHTPIVQKRHMGRQLPDLP